MPLVERGFPFPSVTLELDISRVILLGVACPAGAPADEPIDCTGFGVFR